MSYKTKKLNTCQQKAQSESQNKKQNIYTKNKTSYNYIIIMYNISTKSELQNYS